MKESMVKPKVKKSKTLNVLRTLDYIREHSSVSAAELSQSTEIPIASIYRLLQSMSEYGLLSCMEKQESNVGRKAVAYSVNPDYRHMLGIYMRKKRLNVFITDMLGRICASYEAYYPQNCSRDTVICMIDDGIHTVTESQFGEGVSLSGISFIGVAAEAAVDVNRGEIIEFNDLSCMNGFPVREHLEEKYGLEIKLMKSVQIGTSIYMKDMLASGIQNYIYISVSFGIGIGIVYSGTFYEGAHCSAGELGPLLENMPGYLLGDLYRDVNEYIRRPENVSLRQLYGAEEISMSNNNDMIKLIEAAVENGEAEVIKLLERAAESIAGICAVVTGFLDPQAIIIGGDVGRSTPNIWRKILQKAEKYPKLKETLTAGYKGMNRVEMMAMCLVSCAYEKVQEELIAEI